MLTQRFGIEIEMTGITRKVAAKVVAAHYGGGVAVRYNAGNYSVCMRDGRCWSVVPDGSISEDNGEEVELVSPILTYDDMEDLQQIIRDLRKAGAKSGPEYGCGIHVHVDGINHNVRSLTNLVHIMASKEDMLFDALQVSRFRAIKYCKKTEIALLELIKQSKPRRIEDLRALWYGDRYIHTERRHRSRYHALNLHSYFVKGTVEFRLFNGTLHAGKVRAYVVLCLAMSHQARKQTSASPKKAETDNPKYTFRCWLLRLGLIGDQFKNCRKHLLEHLPGNSAWRHVRAA